MIVAVAVVVELELGLEGVHHFGVVVGLPWSMTRALMICDRFECRMVVK